MTIYLAGRRSNVRLCPHSLSLEHVLFSYDTLRGFADSRRLLRWLGRRVVK